MDKDQLILNKVKNLYWDKECTVKEVAQNLGVSVWSLYNLMGKHNMPRRSATEANYVVNKNKPQFEVKSKFNFLEQKLKVAGIMLYWAEGSFSGNFVDFANSDAEMVKIFLRFLREICGVKEERLRVYLYGYAYQDIEELKNYWHKVTGISLKQFTKPYVRTGNTNVSKRKLPYGLIHVRYNDKRLLDLINHWLFEYIRNWAGAGVVNRIRL